VAKSKALPTVSVIIPSYNAAATLPRAIESVIAQRPRSSEIIVVDDGSTDDTDEQIQPYLRYIRYCRQANAGSAVARNRGIELSTGQYIAFLDADDEWLPGKLIRQISDLERNKTIGLSSTGAVIVDSTSAAVDVISYRYRGDMFRRILEFNPIVCSSVVLRRSQWLATGLRFEGAPSSMEDYALWLKLAARCHFSVLPNLLVRYHLTPTSKTAVRSVEQHRQDMRYVFSEAARDAMFCKRYSAERIQGETSVRLSVAREYMVRGFPMAARKELAYAVASDWRAPTYRVFWNTLLWSGRLRAALKAVRRRLVTRVWAA
jgi:glycosyltransferase involved in cell wall biosynthesis